VTYTTTAAYTRTNTAVHLSGVIMGTISDILSQLQVDLTTLFRDWAQNETAISAWIEEGSLSEVVLECHQPNGTVSPVLEFPVTYTVGGAADSAFTADRAALARYRAKLTSVPRGTTAVLVCTFNWSPHKQMAGWGPGTRAQVGGLQANRFGTLGTAPDASVGLRILGSW